MFDSDSLFNSPCVCLLNLVKSADSPSGGFLRDGGTYFCVLPLVSTGAIYGFSRTRCVVNTCMAA